MDHKERKGDIAIKELPAAERPREKMMRYGPGFLSNGELISILIGTGTKELSALALANRVLAMEEEGLPFLADCTCEELCRIEGIGAAKSCQILAAIELGKRLSGSLKKDRFVIGSPKDIADLCMEELRYRKKEYFRVFYLNTKNEVTATEDASIGNLNSSIVHPREIFRNAVKKGAAAIIVAHNHPSGNPLPSQNDIDITKRLVEVGELIGIPVLDHLIIGDGSYISLKEKQLM
jgi:DNA repair protein RadC